MSLRFAQRLSNFESILEWGSYGDGGGNTEHIPIYKSYARLLERLVDLDETLPEAVLLTSLVEALDVYDMASAEENRNRQESDSRSSRQRTEIARKNDLALTVECPTCSQPRGLNCRTSSGGYKGHDHHVTRFRAATDPAWKGAAE